MNLLKKLGYRLGLKLHEFEQQEFNYAQQLTPSRRQSFLGLVNTAYRLQREAKNALNIALDAKSKKSLWVRAYTLALDADLAAKPIIKSKYEDLHFFKIFAILFFFANVLLIVLSLHRTKHTKDSSQIIDQVIFASGVLIVYRKLFLLNSDRIIAALTTSQVTEVLNAASEAGIDFNDSSPGERLADSTSLICKIINHVENSVELSKINIAHIPDELMCPITHEIMTDPVYSEQCQHRYERTAILKWLDRRTDDPITRRPLDQDDLIRDFDLKRKVDGFVETRTNKPIDQATETTYAFD